MKSLIKIAFVILALLPLSNKSLAFDTLDGQYLSQQDLFLVLRSVFVKPGLLDEVDSDLSYSPFGENKFYELGFINLESGQPMAQSPAESYILYIDIFINRAMNRMAYLSYDLFQKALFSTELIAYFEQKMKDHTQQTGQYLSFQQYIVIHKYSSLAPEFQAKFVQDLLVFIYLENALVPPALSASIMTSIVPLMITKDFNIQTAITTVIKKGIISDHFLKY